ncbi:hypothetical protein CTEN210_09163 [Chaetoceros tenuissimus]|uniref:SGF29 C-terminal domain-containing protein n=1 Tax=Chaetoceros tenuissimus TaxID=426638 RepID=A0AAD3CV91_9STRA|nr:hypothetical protein CTEN210_09163 [Chaetoceros tenuissimus]
MSSNETYLEKFIESISTVPTEIQRNLHHMKSLDEQYSHTTEDLRDVQEEYLQGVYNVIHSLNVDLHPQRKKLKLQEMKDGTQDATVVATAIGGTKEDEANKESQETDAETKEEHEEASDSNDTDSDNESKEALDLSNPPEGIIVPLNTTEQPSEEETKLMIPTTEELRQMTQNKQALLEIASLRQTAQQITAEKLSTTHQNLKIVNSILSKLDQDLLEYETLLKATGQYEDTQGSVSLYVDQLAAIQVVANSQEWILAKVMQHDEQTGMYHLSDEDIESNKTFILPESQVVILGGLSTLNRNDVIYAVYPDTTSFYQATVVEMTKQMKGKDPLVLVHFKDDGDEHGITHAKAVPMKHVMKVPYGAIQT